MTPTDSLSWPNDRGVMLMSSDSGKTVDTNGPNKRTVCADRETVYAEERLRIDRRRVVAGLSQPCSDCGENVNSAKKEGPDPESDPHFVGLALSGGGLRSAMFNLGLLQAFQQAGLMRFVDYLATVSGGGYVGGYYAALGNTDLKIGKPHQKAAQEAS